MKRFYMYFFLILFSNFYIYSFNTLSEAQTFASSNPENVSSDNRDIANPNYSSFYKKRFGQFSYLARKAYRKKSLWSAYNFKNLIDDQINTRVTSGYYDNFVQKITPIGATVFVWGPLHGAFHSLVRSLNYLKRNGLINDNFKITSPNCFLIFDGNVVGGSPYILETLTLILLLMKENKDRVFYIKGKLEYQSYWQNHGLDREIKFKLKEISADAEILKKLLNKFFNTLPLALYFDGINPFDGLLRVSYFPMYSDIIKEDYCTRLLSNLYINKLDTCRMNPPEIKGAPPVAAIIRHSDHGDKFMNFSSLLSLEPDIGATAWKVFSSPLSVFQDYFNVFHDAFFCVKIGFKLAESTISIISRDVRENLDFQIKTFNLITTQELSPINLNTSSVKTDFSDEKITSLQNRLNLIKNNIEKLNFEIYKSKINLENIDR